MTTVRPTRQRLRIKVAVALSAIAMLVLSSPALASSADRSTSPVYWFDESGNPTDQVAGESRLVRTDHGISMDLRTTGLEPGHTYTVWWVIFNDPSACEVPYMCGPGDILVMNPEAEAAGVVGYAAGNVVGNNGSFNAGARLNIGDSSGFLESSFLGIEHDGLTAPRDAEVHLIVRSHGPLVPAWIPRQIQSFGGGCLGLDPLLDDGEGFPCFDPQFSVHQAN
jgi:hypothetical protein